MKTLELENLDLVKLNEKEITEIGGGLHPLILFGVGASLGYMLGRAIF